MKNKLAKLWSAVVDTVHLVLGAVATLALLGLMAFAVYWAYDFGWLQFAFSALILFILAALISGAIRWICGDIVILGRRVVRENRIGKEQSSE